MRWPVITRPDIEDFWDGETLIAVGNGADDPAYGDLWAAAEKATSIKQAWQQSPSNRPMILIWPGTYTETLHENVHSGGGGVFRGMGATPHQVDWHSYGSSYGSNVTFRTRKHRVLFENLQMRNGAAWESTIQSYDPEFHCISNRVNFVHTGVTHAINWRSTLGSTRNPAWPQEFHNCRITRGYNQFSWVNLSALVVTRTLIVSPNMTSQHGNTGSIEAWDWTEDPSLEGYGLDYGDNLVQFIDWTGQAYRWSGVVARNYGIGPVRVALMRPSDRRIVSWTRPNALGAWDIHLFPWMIPEGEAFLLYLSDGCRPQIEGPYPPTEIIAGE
jgi:hypothetical protein